MAHKFATIAFTPTVRELQRAYGSRQSYAGMDEGEDYNFLLSEREASFIAARDSFYMASVGETGWPYVQHRGGATGFVKVLGESTIGFADYSGNRQYVSIGNIRTDDRVSLFFMDYRNRRRLKMLGRVRIVGPENTDILAQLEDRDYAAKVERAFIIEVEAFDWNCPQHITPRFTESEIKASLDALIKDNQQLRDQLEGRALVEPQAPPESMVLGDGPMELVVSGVRQLTPRVRAFEFRDPHNKDLPTVEPGSHLRLPVQLPGGELTERHYSIASNPARRDIYEIAVLREDHGSGGSRALHATYQIGTRVRIEPPANHFGLHDDQRSAVLIAGGIGITPIKAMAQELDKRRAQFDLHYAGKSRNDMAFRDRLERQFGDRLHTYSSAEGERFDVTATLKAIPDDALIYACGPSRLINAVKKTARELDITHDRIRLELFS